MPKEPYVAPAPPDCRESMGLAPGLLAKRDFSKANSWCPNPSNIEYDRWCDPSHPKTIHYDMVVKADKIIRDIVPRTPLLKSNSTKKFGMELFFKLETVHKTGNFHERSAIYVLLKLTPEQRQAGVYTASVGNWAMALAYHAQLLKIQATVVLPFFTALDIVEKCQSFGATVVLSGRTIDEAKKRAFILISEAGRVGTYINGYDHPYVIAGAGTIGVEIIEQLPTTDAIIVPIGGGGLIAGISTYIKHVKPEVLIYGVEPGKSCSFLKALHNERPYQIQAEKGAAASLIVPTAGANAFHTARSLIDRMVLVNDDWTARAILHLVEEEKLIAEGAGAISLGALLSIPDILPELHGKNVVCIISGGNMNTLPLVRSLVRAKTIEGRYVIVTIRLVAGRSSERHKILKIIENVGCNVIQCQAERQWLDEDSILDSFITLQCETRDLKHACTLRRVLDKLFPGICVFADECFRAVPMCSCFPKKKGYQPDQEVKS